MSRPNKPSTKSRQWEGFPLDSKGRFNGKPLEHWKRMAVELVIDVLARGAMNQDTKFSPVGRIAHRRLLEIAAQESPELLQKSLEERARCQAGLAVTMEAMLGHPQLGPAMQAAGFRKKREKHAVHRVRTTG
jgi:hypothetical protein